MTSKLHDLILSYKVDKLVKLLSYGTTGYRMNFKYLEGITVRLSILAAVRSIYKKNAVGLMITASHNPEDDNGIKLIDPNGDMLAQDWESIAMEFVQWEEKDFLFKFQKACIDMQINFSDNYKGHVLIGFDTRKSSPQLADIATSVLKEIGSDFFVFELITTPQLHFFVNQYNKNILQDYKQLFDHYFERLVRGFCLQKKECGPKAVLNIDCANGVGARHLLHLSTLIANYLELKLYNTESANLNLNCGADYIKIKQCVPQIYNGDQSNISIGQRWCSIDGDADRLIYFYISTSNKVHLLDGDKMAVLIADFLSEMLKYELQSNQLSMAIIQTAYANSASTEYIENHLGIKTECVPTGVKYLHKAARRYDIGIYFEANGHGTVLFSEKLKNLVSKSNIFELKRLISIINEADGDAISDILIIEHILSLRNWSLEKWSTLYSDYPNRQLKVSIPDRSVIITADGDRRISSPSTLQNAIDKVVNDQLISGFKHSRAFVRPSGTEDVVRIYAESTTQQGADQLANTIKLLILSILND